jgi:hypothetical protein
MSSTLKRQEVGNVGDAPGRLLLSTTATQSEVVEPGFINAVAAASSVTVNPSDIVFAYMSDTTAIFYPSFGSGGVITLVDITTSENSVGYNQLASPIVMTNTVGVNVEYTSNTATPGTVRCLKGQNASTETTITSGNLVGVRGEVDMKGASGGFFYGTQGKVIATGTLSGSSWTAPLFGQLDISAATVNGGQTAPVWADYGSASGTITSGTGMRMFAGTNTTAATLNSMIYLYGKSNNLLELDLNGSTYVSSGGSGTLSGTIEKIAITINGTQYYIPCATVIS